VNNHVNNARYLDWIFDCYDDAFVRSHLLSFLQVNYVGETALVTRSPSPGGRRIHPGVDYIEGVSRRKGSRVVQAIVGWNPHCCSYSSRSFCMRVRTHGLAFPAVRFLFMHEARNMDRHSRWFVLLLAFAVAAPFIDAQVSGPLPRGAHRRMALRPDLAR